MKVKREGGESRTTRCIYSPKGRNRAYSLSHALCLQGSLDSEPQDVSAGTLVITRGWPWQRTIWIGVVFVNAERVCMRREPICSMVSLILLMLVCRCA